MSLVPKVTKETLELPGLGSFKFEWMKRSVISQREIKYNLVMHIFHIKDAHLMDNIKAAWTQSGIADQGISLEMNYTDEFEGYVIDAYDIILFAIDPSFTQTYKDMFVNALKKVYQEKLDELQGRDADSADGNAVQAVQRTTEKQARTEDQEGDLGH
jgi:hypothetical protein